MTTTATYTQDEVQRFRDHRDHLDTDIKHLERFLFTHQNQYFLSPVNLRGGFLSKEESGYHQVFSVTEALLFDSEKDAEDHAKNIVPEHFVCEVISVADHIKRCLESSHLVVVSLENLIETHQQLV